MKFYIKRFITLIITLFLISLLTFIAFQVIPGDAALSKLSVDAEDEAIEALRIELGLNLSLPERFIRFMAGAVTGNFGSSIQYGIPVTELIANRLPVTIWLAILSFVFIVIFSIPLGILSARWENMFLDRIITLLTQTLMAVPAFFLGIIITILFGITFKWFVPGAYVSMEKSISGFFHYLMYPAAAVAIPKIAMTVKFLRSSVLREMQLDYVRTAKSKGNSEVKVLWYHVLKNALIPVITFMGMIAADALAGSIVIEQVFNLPGIGRLLVVAISNRDYPVVQTIVLYIASVVIIINFIIDLTYQKIDPRVRMAD